MILVYIWENDILNKYQLAEDIAPKREISRLTGKSEDSLHFEITKVALCRSGLKLKVEIRLNFVMPRHQENIFKRSLIRDLPDITDVEFFYIMDKDAESDIKVRKGRGRRALNEPVRSGVIYGRRISAKPVDYDQAKSEIGKKGLTTVCGKIFKLNEPRVINKKLILIEFAMADHIKSIKVKCFMDNSAYEKSAAELVEGAYVCVAGNAEIDRYDMQFVLMARSINLAEELTKQDDYPGKHRVELHVHTKMSDNDGFNDTAELVNCAAEWGQPAVAITDHGVVQSFPAACAAADELAKRGKKIKIIYGMEGYLYDDYGCIASDGSIDIKKRGTHHIIFLVKNLKGLRNLYKMVSCSHIDYFYKKPRLPRSVIEKYREGIVVGTACEAGEFYRAVRSGASDEELIKIASFYDYLEIQPLGNNQFMIDKGIVKSREDLIAINKKILEVGDRLGKPTVATTDSHYPTPESAINRNIVMAAMGFTETQSDSLYLRTTGEMMDEFSYLGERAYEVVVENTNKISDMIEEIRPVPSERCYPEIPNAVEKLKESCYGRAHEIYGDHLPQVIEERLETELESIIGNGYAALYVAAQMLVKKSESDGYIVGSRGSVGSSFAATMAGITEINPLKPHYVCPKCKYFEPNPNPDKYDVGFDMPDKICPRCGTAMKKDGFNIPFATFLGFAGDKEPDIDLNFAGEYQQVAHRYVGEIFGENNIFKAGTVATIKERTAYGYVMHYMEDRGIKASGTDIDLLVKGCTNVKRTTGQHPGGIIVLPRGHEIYEFTPIQKPANKRDTDIITTHYDYHKIDKNLLKLDILGHDAPSILRHLQDMTGVAPSDVPLDDPVARSIFISKDALKIKNPDYKLTHATYAIPEFGTEFTCNMLDEIKPTTYSELVKMSGFSHGTAVWQGNAEDLIRNGTATIDEVISCRDDIMNYLIDKEIEPSLAFSIMEHVRKNKPLNDEELDIMRSHGVPEWYIESCRTLQYLFPRAHAAAYVMHSLRFAWFKVNYPAEFYAAWITSKVDDFDVEVVAGGMRAVERQMNLLGSMTKPTQTEQNQRILMEVIYEMFSRGYEFSMPIPGRTDALKFNVIDGKVNIPYRAFTGIGERAAESLDEAYKERKFTSLDDVKRRTKLTEKNIEQLNRYGVFGSIPQSAQVSLSEFF